MEQLEKQDKTVRKLKKQLKVFAKKIGELEGIYVFMTIAEPWFYILYQRLKSMAQFVCEY